MLEAKSTLVCIDVVSKSGAHNQFNSLVLLALADKQEYKIIFICRENSMAKEYLHILSNVELIEIRGLRYPYICFRSVYTLIKDYHKSDVLFLAIDNTLTPFLLSISKILALLKINSIRIVLHSNIENIYCNARKLYAFRLMNKLFSPICMVLTPSLSTKYTKVFAKMTVRSCLHPNFGELNALLKLPLPRVRQDNSESLNIYVSKSHANRFSLGDIHVLQSSIEGSKVHISFVGRSDFGELSNISTISSNSTISDYYTQLSLYDYVLFSKNVLSDLRASGVLMDALSMGVSFIAPRQGHFKDINDELHIGFLYEDIVELMSILRTLTDRENVDESRLLEVTGTINMIEEFGL